MEEDLLNKGTNFSLIPLNKVFARRASKEEMNIWDYIKNENNKARITRNKFSHGLEITEDEFYQFQDFCNSIMRVADEIIQQISGRKSN